MFSNRRPSAKILLSSLYRRGYTVTPSSLQRSHDEERQAREWEKITGNSAHWLERTPFETAVVFAFDEQTFNWLDRLRLDDPEPEWHTIIIDPDTSPICDVEDWEQVAPGRAEALAFVLYEMDRVRAEPIQVQSHDDDTLSIVGRDGPIATIRRTHFSDAPIGLTRRAERCLRGLRVDAPRSHYANRLSKLPGLKGLSESQEEEQLSPSLSDYDNRQPLHITCANLCTALHCALQPHLKEKLSRNDTQELLAAYFGFESWQHLRSREKTRAAALQTPMLVTAITVEETGDWTTKQSQAFRSIPEGLAAFADASLTVEPRTICVHHMWRLFSIDTIGRYSLEHRIHHGESAKPGHYSRLQRFPDIEYDQNYLYVAAALLYSPSIEADLKSHYATGSPAVERARQIDARLGVAKSDHLNLHGWHFSVNEGRGTPYLKVERVSDIGRPVEYGDTCTVELHKASIVAGPDAALWLATDWDRKPVFRLEGLTESDAQQLERQFFARSNDGIARGLNPRRYKRGQS